ncbi:6-phosphogluconolactonase [Palleronia sp. LCG004]|uniref:6-phosphogluconolactonase n=1 Tax=Palleronia sp. LCG004 TaxID=3079304 RepID=UPI002942D56E|nr:6-phosphogluconolactonase [Palleronia sp. LCG004]WOI57167.1 6-phosphogluconolactonase [Palleronia sp. LCG004]
MELIEYPDAEMMMMQLADKLAGEISRSLSSHDRVSFVVPGGSTPGPIFDSLSGASLDWDRVRVMLTDERLVPADHERSNERLVRERLLTDKASAAQFVRLVPDGEIDIDTLLEERLRPELPISILLLGMGADMHCASLFPGSPELEAALSADAPALMQIEAPGGLEPRVTLTMPVLRDAVSVHVVITGTEKREALDRARKLDPKEAPIAAILSDATVHWAKE